MRRVDKDVRQGSDKSSEWERGKDARRDKATVYLLYKFSLTWEIRTPSNEVIRSVKPQSARKGCPVNMVITLLPPTMGELTNEGIMVHKEPRAIN